MQPNETGWKTLAITHLQAASDELIHCRHTLELGESDCKDGMQRKKNFSEVCKRAFSPESRRREQTLCRAEKL